MNSSRFSLFAVSLLAASMLTACGGGDSSGNLDLFPTNLTVSAGSSQSLPAGQTFVLTGVGKSQNTVITQMHWQLGRNSQGTDYSGEASLKNDDCTIMGASQDSNYKSIRSCTTNITLPVAAQGQTYTAILSITDDKGNSNSASTTINVTAANGALTVSSGAPISARYGQVVTPQCIANGGYLYNGMSPVFEFFWVNGKDAAIALAPAATQYIASRDGIMVNAIGTTSFTVPVNAQQEDSVLKLGCSVLDSRGQKATSTQDIKMLASPPVQANAGDVQVVRPSALVKLQGSATDPLESSYTDGQVPTLYYFWKQRKVATGTPVNIALTSPSTPTPTFIAPEILTTDGQRNVYTFDFYADRKPIDPESLDVYENSPSHAETRILVDNYDPLNLVLDSPKKAVASETVKMTASVTNAPIGMPVYFVWKQVSGTTVNLSPVDGGMSFLVPSSLIKPEVLAFEVVASLYSSMENVDKIAPTEKAVYYVYLNDFAPLSLTVKSPQAVTPNTPAVSSVTTSSVNYTVYYRWTQTQGTPVIINNANSQNASFTSPALAGEISFRVDASSAPFSGTGASSAPVVSATIDFTVK